MRSPCDGLASCLIVLIAFVVVVNIAVAVAILKPTNQLSYYYHEIPTLDSAGDVRPPRGRQSGPQGTKALFGFIAMREEVLVQQLDGVWCWRKEGHC